MIDPRSLPALLFLLGVAGGCAHESYAPTTDAIMKLPDAFLTTTQASGPGPRVCAVLAEGPVEPLTLRVATANLDLKVAAARLRRSEALAVQARSPRLPRLDSQVEFSRGNGSPGSTVSSIPLAGSSVTESYRASLAASFEVDAWGRVSANAKAAGLDAVASAELLESLRITVHAQTLETWYSLVAQRRLIDLLEEQAGTSSQFLELTRLRFALGQTPAQDIGRQRQNLLGLEGQLAQARERASLLEARLAALAGTARPMLDVEVPRTLPPLPDAAEPGLPGSLVARRPDVRAAMASLAAADRRTAAAAAGRLPRLTLSGSLFSLGPTLGDLLSDTLFQMSLAAGAPVYDAGDSRARIEAAEATAAAELYAWATTLLTAYREVEDALVSNRRQAEFSLSLDEQLDEAVRVVELTRDSYRLGQGDYLDVLNALSSHQTLQRQRLEAQRQQFINRVTLCRALGIGPIVDSMAPATVAAPGLRKQGDRS